MFFDLSPDLCLMQLSVLCDPYTGYVLPSLTTTITFFLRGSLRHGLQYAHELDQFHRGAGFYSQSL